MATTTRTRTQPDLRPARRSLLDQVARLEGELLETVVSSWSRREPVRPERRHRRARLPALARAAALRDPRDADEVVADADLVLLPVADREHFAARVTREETSAFVIWLMLVIIVVVVLDGGLIAGLVMALAGILIGFLAVRRRRTAGRG